MQNVLLGAAAAAAAAALRRVGKHAASGFSASAALPAPKIAAAAGSAAPPVLGAGEALRRARTLAEDGKARVHAFYSSALGGVVVDPALMQMPLTDHMVHRGHGVFDTATLANGRLYRLSVHLERLLTSAERARIPHGFTVQGLKERVEAACAASGQQEAAVRFWLTAGTGDFHWLPEDTVQKGGGCFYCAVFSASGMQMPDASRGIEEVTVSDSVPWKPPLLASIKSNNYMLNCMMGMASRDKGGWFGIAVDADGFIGESCVGNIAAVIDGTLVTPPFEGILAGTTTRRTLEMAARGRFAAVLPGGAQQRRLHADEARSSAAELMILGGDTHVMPIVKYDGKPVGDGSVGPVAKAVLAALEADRDAEEADSSNHHVVNYSMYQQA